MTLIEKVKYQDYQNEDSQNSKFLNEIKEKVKHIYSMEENLNILENKFKNYNPNYDLHITKENIIKLNGSKSLRQSPLQKSSSFQNKNMDLSDSSQKENIHKINSVNNNKAKIEYKEINLKMTIPTMSFI
jgi:hypothetical protein